MDHIIQLNLNNCLFLINLLQAQIEYECKYGYNLLPRCSMCFKGDGCKILQCFNCEYFEVVFSAKITSYGKDV